MFDRINGARIAAVSVLTVMLVGFGGLVSGASAAPNADAIDAIEAVAADILVYGGALILLVVAAIGIAIGIKYLRKARSAA